VNSTILLLFAGCQCYNFDGFSDGPAISSFQHVVSQFNSDK